MTTLKIFKMKAHQYASRCHKPVNAQNKIRKYNLNPPGILVTAVVAVQLTGCEKDWKQPLFHLSRLEQPAPRLLSVQAFLSLSTEEKSQSFR